MARIGPYFSIIRKGQLDLNWKSRDTPMRALTVRQRCPINVLVHNLFVSVNLCHGLFLWEPVETPLIGLKYAQIGYGSGRWNEGGSWAQIYVNGDDRRCRERRH
jgi:hypothetical protein